MLKEPTIEKLHALRLRIMAAAWLEQDKSPDTLALPFESSRDPQSPRGPSHRTGLVGLTSGSSGHCRS